MAIQEYYTGTKTIAALSTEYVLNTTTPETAYGVYQLMLNTTALTATDTLIIKIKEKITSGGTQVIVLQDTLFGVQSTLGWVSPSMLLINGWDMSITQTTGTVRSFPFSIRRIS